MTDEGMGVICSIEISLHKTAYRILITYDSSEIIRKMEITVLFRGNKTQENNNHRVVIPTRGENTTTDKKKVDMSDIERRKRGTRETTNTRRDKEKESIGE
jgi:hypothetical protein